MLYSGAKGNNDAWQPVVADGAAAPPLNRNVSLPDSGHSRPAGRGQQATFADASPVLELNVWNRDANQALPGHDQSLTVLN